MWKESHQVEVRGHCISHGSSAASSRATLTPFGREAVSLLPQKAALGFRMWRTNFLCWDFYFRAPKIQQRFFFFPSWLPLSELVFPCQAGGFFRALLAGRGFSGACFVMSLLHVCQLNPQMISSGWGVLAALAQTFSIGHEPRLCWMWGFNSKTSWPEQTLQKPAFSGIQTWI